MHKCMNVWMYEYMYECINEMKRTEMKWMNEWMIELNWFELYCVVLNWIELTHEWMNVWMNECMYIYIYTHTHDEW